MLHFWLNHDYPQGGCAQQKIVKDAKVCLPCGFMLLIFFLVATQLQGAFAHSNRVWSCPLSFRWKLLTIRSNTRQASSPHLDGSRLCEFPSGPSFYQGLGNGSALLPQKKTFYKYCM